MSSPAAKSSHIFSRPARRCVRVSMHAAFSALFRGKPAPRVRHSPALSQRYCPCIARKHDQHRLAVPSRSAPEAPDTQALNRSPAAVYPPAPPNGDMPRRPSRPDKTVPSRATARFFTAQTPKGHATAVFRYSFGAACRRSARSIRS